MNGFDDETVGVLFDVIAKAFALPSTIVELLHVNSSVAAVTSSAETGGVKAPV